MSDDREKLYPNIKSIPEIVAEEVAKQCEEGIEKVLTLHTRALACHCECLGMNAENSFAVCIGKQIPYNDDSYLATLRKWGLIDEKGNPII